jgi:hypothetical protein
VNSLARPRGHLARVRFASDSRRTIASQRNDAKGHERKSCGATYSPAFSSKVFNCCFWWELLIGDVCSHSPTLNPGRKVRTSSASQRAASRSSAAVQRVLAWCPHSLGFLNARPRWRIFGKKALAEEAVYCEPVSSTKFPANSEKYREFSRYWAASRNRRSLHRPNSATYSKIPYKSEQGNSEERAANSFSGTANGRKRPFLTHL